MDSPGRRIWALLALSLLLMGLALLVVHDSGGTQRDLRRELRKF